MLLLSAPCAVLFAVPGNPVAGAFPPSTAPGAPQIAVWTPTCLPGQSFVVTGANLASVFRGVAASADGATADLQIHGVKDGVLTATVPATPAAPALSVQLQNAAGWSAAFPLNRA